MKSARRRLKAGTGLLGLAVMLGGLMGCVSPDLVEKDFGNSVHNNMAQSVLNPQAGLTDTPAVGLTPKAGASEMDAYNKSFTGEKAGTASTGGMGSSGGSTGTPSAPGY